MCEELRQDMKTMYGEEGRGMPLTIMQTSDTQQTQSEDRIDLRPRLGHRGSKREQPCLYMIGVKRWVRNRGLENR